MPVVQSLISHNELFQNTDYKIMLNDIKLSEASDIKNEIYTIYENEISLIPTCKCGYYKGEFFKGETCPLCKTKVSSIYDDLTPVFWVKKFREDLPFVNPKFWLLLSRVIHQKIDALRYLGDTSYNPPRKPPILEHLTVLIGGRSYKNLINNLGNIIDFLINNSSFKTKAKQDKLRELKRIYEENKDKILSDYLPLFNRKLFLMEKDVKGSFVVKVASDAIDIATEVIFLSNNLNVTDKRKENKTAWLISAMGKLFTKYVEDLIAKKGGLVRRNIYGARSHFTFRRVASSLRSIYDYDTVHVPWQVGPVVYRPQLLGKLIRRGYTLKEAQAKLDNACLHYDKEIDELLHELIEESPYKGLPVLMNRNPSLGKGSIHLMYITKFKTDLEDTTVSVSVQVAVALNLDFDGKLL